MKAMKFIDNLLTELGYRNSPFYRESDNYAGLPMPHLLRDARRAQVRGTYFIRTMGDDAGGRQDRPAVHVAEANSPEDARRIHRCLWNQGATPFLIVSLPGQVRVYTPFAYDEKDEQIGQVVPPVDRSLGLRGVVNHLKFLRGDSIDSGEIWKTRGSCLRRDRRVDRTLLKSLGTLSRLLVEQHGLKRDVAHSLVGRFVYLNYLREREILSDRWLDSVHVEPGSVFSPNVDLDSFRRLADAVDERFNGRIFPIDWRASGAPDANAVKTTGRAFAGEDVISGQMSLFPFDFSYIPIELLSSIYEQFLHDEGKGAKEGAFYTSETVADYLLAELESVKPLKLGMKVLDPCCGSGIFLVLAFRRLVEQELTKRGVRNLPPRQLGEILTSSIFGVERNPEACLVTEFSLILALLSYVDPPELHRYEDFQFPTLHGNQVFEADFFSNDTLFWQSNERFDWIIGNPPWIELSADDKKEQPAISWIQLTQKTCPIARFRSSEAFTWRVRERLSEDTVVGLVIQATTLTNDQSKEYRKAFFAENEVHRISNFSNLAYILFESAEEPAATLVYSVSSSKRPRPDVVHFGPLVVNQLITTPDRSRRRKTPWVLTICESDIQVIPFEEAASGNAATWKRALWGNPRDRRSLQRLRGVFPTTLGQVVEHRGWTLNLGLQLRDNKGSLRDPNQDIASILRAEGMSDVEGNAYARWFAGLKVLEPKHPRKADRRLTVSEDWLVSNRWGTFLRKGRKIGLSIICAPHVFLWNEYAAFDDHDFILRHPSIGLAAPPEDVDWLKAISVIWTSSITPYCLFLELSAGWGISRSTIDLGDARCMPMPDLSRELVRKLAALHGKLVGEEEKLMCDNRFDWQQRLDEGVASTLSIPPQIMLLAREFRDFRLPLVKGKAPLYLTCDPDKVQFEKYADRLKAELDGFMERKSRHHAVTVLHSTSGIIVTVELKDRGSEAHASVREAGTDEQETVRAILRAAEKRYGQWVYVRRSVRVFEGRKIHMCKPARRLEWTETQALLDADDIIAEVADSRGREA